MRYNDGRYFVGRSKKAGRMRVSETYVVFQKRNGQSFKKYFRTSSSKARAIVAWRKRGGKVLKW